MSTPSDENVANPALPATADESTLFTTANNLLLLLTDCLKERPHGQISLGQLPDVFLIKAQLEELKELEGKKVKHLGTLVQLAMDRDDEGVKGGKKRVKNTGTQATAMKQAVAEQVAIETEDLQRHNTNIEDRLKKAEKLLETSNNANKCLEDKINFLTADFNKFVKGPKVDAQRSSNDALKPVEARLTRIEEKAEAESVTVGDLSTRLDRADVSIAELYEYGEEDDGDEEKMAADVAGLLAGKKENDIKHAESDLKHLQSDTKHVEAALKQQRQGWAIDSLRHKINNVSSRLEYVVNVFNANCPRVENTLRELISSCRKLQLRVGIMVIGIWEKSDELESKYLAICTCIWRLANILQRSMMRTRCVCGASHRPGKMTSAVRCPRSRLAATQQENGCRVRKCA